MIHKMGYDCQCDTCGKALHWDEVCPDTGDCDDCTAKYHEKIARYWRGRWDAERYGEAACGGDLA